MIETILYVSLVCALLLVGALGALAFGSLLVSLAELVEDAFKRISKQHGSPAVPEKGRR